MRRYPGESNRRQAVHTVYGGAHLFKADSARKLGEVASRSLKENASEPGELAQALGINVDSELVRKIYDRIADKLQREPVEDYRLDFEDGYGNRPDAEEDGHAVSTAQAVARSKDKGGFPAFIGIRIKPFTEALRQRSMRTLDLFLTSMLSESRALPDGFVVTLPKVTVPEQVTALVRLLETMANLLGI